MVFGALQQYILDQVGLQWTLCIETLILLTGVICGLLLIPGPTNEKEALRLINEKEALQVTNQKEEQMQGNNATAEDKHSCLAAARDIFDLSLFKKLSYILYCTGLFLVVLGYYIPDIYLPEYAMSRGITAQKSANLISFIGFSNLSSRVLFGYVGDLGPSVRIGICGFSITVLGMISVALPFFKTYPIFLVYAILFGTSVGCFVSLFSVILVDLYGLIMLEKSLGQALAAISFVFLFGSPLIGFLVDTSGEAAIPFYVPGAACTFGGLIFSAILCVHDFNHKDYEGIS